MQPSGCVTARVSATWRLLALAEAAGLVALAFAVTRARPAPHAAHEPAPASRAAAPIRPAEHAGHGAVPDERSPVTVAPERWAPLGVRLGEVQRQEVSPRLRAVATVAIDESRVTHVHARFAGWVERLGVRTTGEQVRSGQVVASIFSRELWTAQNELLAVARASPSLLDGARSRLRVLGMSAPEIAAVEQSGKPHRTVAVTAPKKGIVVHRNVSAGAAVDPSTGIVTLADLTKLWVLAEIPEGEVSHVQRGSRATLVFPGAGGGPIPSQVAFLYPTLTERTRTLRVRFDVDNAGGKLRPGMYGVAEIPVESAVAVSVPRDAVVDTGRAAHVFVLGADGAFVPRTVELGARMADRVEIKHGLEPGERIVESGVFLIDSESRLRGSVGGAHAGHGG
ncbi:MAG: efflux RND transporter periplasmic adaptor subunit [Myxococcales bacterium]|nr:efflux RND transporter periplasmic adaptor subunit [Myxococcales bacterium]